MLGGFADITKSSTGHWPLLQRALGRGRRIHPARRSSLDDMRLAFQGTAFACMDARARAIAAMQWTLWRDEEMSTPLPEDHWLVRLFKNPNYYITRSNIFGLISNWYDFEGQAIVYAPVRKIGRRHYPVDMWVVSPRSTYPVAGTTGEKLIEGYDISLNGWREVVPEEDVISLNKLLPGADARALVRGQGRFFAALDAAISEKSIWEFIRDYFERGAQDNLILTSPDQIKPTEMDLYREKLEEVAPNLQILAGLQRGARLEPFPALGGTGSRDIIQTLGLTSVMAIEGIFGCPGLVSQTFTSYASAVEMNAAFQHKTVEPLAEEYAEHFTRAFRRVDPDIYISFKKHQYKTPDQVRQDDEFAFKWGLKTRNEWRLENGMEAIEGGDTFMVPVNYVPLEDALSRAAETVPEPLPDSGGAEKLIGDFWRAIRAVYPKEVPAEYFRSAGRVLNSYLAPVAKSYCQTGEIRAMFNGAGSVRYILPEGLTRQLTDSNQRDFTEEFKALYWKSFDDIAERQTPMLEERLKPVVEQLGDAILGGLPEVLTVRGQKDVDFGGPLFDLEAWKKLLAEEATEPTQELIYAVFEKALTDVGQNWDEIESDFDVAINRRIKDSTDKIAVTAETIHDEVIAKIQKAAEDNKGKPQEELERAIREAVAGKIREFSEMRIRRIARTTYTFTIGASQNSAWSAVKIAKVFWLTQRDGTVRKTHRKADGQAKDEHGNYQVGRDTMKHPGAGSLPEENVNCRCGQVPLPEKDDAKALYFFVAAFALYLRWHQMRNRI